MRPAKKISLLLTDGTVLVITHDALYLEIGYLLKTSDSAEFEEGRSYAPSLNE